MTPAPQPVPNPARWAMPRAFTHPAFWGALGLLLLNDHVLKGAGVLPAVVTGKLSDFAGMLVAPPLLAWLMGAGRPRARVAAAALTAAALAMLKLWPAAAAFGELLVRSVGLPSGIVADPTDLWAFVLLPLGYALCVPVEHALPSRWRAGVQRSGVALAALACIATTGGKDGSGGGKGDAPAVENASEDPIVLILASTEGAGGCRLYRDDRIAALTADAFVAPRELTLDPGERTALPDDRSETGCGAASIRLPDGDEVLVFWRDLDEIESFVPSDDEQRLDRLVILDGKPGSFDVEIGADLTSFQLGGEAPEPSCETPEPEYSLTFTALAQAQSFLEVSEVRTGADGCLEVDWFEPVADTSPETQSLCIPDWAFPFEAGETLSVVQELLPLGERTLRVTRYDGTRVELQLVVWNEASAFPESRIDKLEPADCFGQLSACGAYLRPVEVYVKARDEALLAGEEVSVRGGDPEETRVLVGTTRDVAWSSATCEGVEARVASTANILELRSY